MTLSEDKRGSFISCENTLIILILQSYSACYAGKDFDRIKKIAAIYK